MVTKNLNAEAILGTTYIDNHVEYIAPRKRVAVLRDGSVIKIQKRGASIPTMEKTKESVTPEPSTTTKVRTSKRIILKPHSECNVEVTTALNGTLLLVPRPELYDKYRLVMANGLVCTKPNVPFIIRVANMSDSPRTLTKNQVLGVAEPAPATVLDITFPDSTIIKSTTTGPESQDPAKPTDSKTEPTVDNIDLSHVQPTLQSDVRQLLKKYEKLFDGTLGEINTTKHRIQLKNDALPVHAQPYRAGPSAREFEHLEVNKMLEHNVIEPAQSEWASPVVIAPKKDGSLRFCVDYRKLNDLTIKDSYPLPRMDECLDTLGNAKVFTTLDANSGYWQVPVAEDDRPKTAFTCHAGCFQFRRMPFGLCNAPATFQRTVDIILSQYRWQSCLVYIDDVIIFSPDPQSHLRHVDEVLSALQRAGVTLKLRKCKFFSDSVDYLGHVVTPGKLHIATTNTKAVEGFKLPRTQTELKSFLGLCNVYRRFVPNFARTAAPLQRLLRKGEPFDLPPMDDDQMKAFNLLKAALSSPPVLRLPQDDLKYSVDTDACDYQIGCALMQTYSDGTRHPIGFWSRSLSPAERNYSVTEKECLAVVWSLQILRPYLERNHFEVYTDHQPLRWLLSLSDASGRLARWRLLLQEMDFTIQYKKGIKNTIADAISRLPTFGETTVAPETDVPCFLIETSTPVDEGSGGTAPRAGLSSILDTTVCPEQVFQSTQEAITQSITQVNREDYAFEEELDYEDNTDHVTARATEVLDVEHSNLEPLTVEELVNNQANDKECEQIKKKICSKKKTIYTEDERGLIVRVAPIDNAVQIYVPKTLRPRLLLLAHYPRLAGHPGGTRMFQTLRRTFYWPSMAMDVFNTVRQCSSCAKERLSLRRHSRFLKLFPAERPLEYVAIDILGPLPRTQSGNKYLLVITDRYSKYVRTVPLRNITAWNIAKALCDHWAFVFGPPKYLLSDNGGQFIAKFFQSVCNVLGTRNLFTTAYHPQTNGQTERFNPPYLPA